MHDSAVLNGNAQGGVTHEQELQASYHADFMNLDDNLFGLDSESRDFIFGRNGMDDNTSNIPNQHYEPSPMQTDSNDLNNILAQMPTPVSNDIRASTSNAFMSPLQVDQQGYDRINGVQYQSHGNDEMFFTPLLSPAVTPMDIMRLHENDSMGSSMDAVYFSPLTSPALERFPHSQNDPRRSQSMVALSNSSSNRRGPDNVADVQRSVRRAPYHSPVVRAANRKRNSITHLNLNANGSQSEQSSDSVSPEPLPSSSMPPPPPRNTSSTKLSEKSSTSGRHRQKRAATGAGEVAPATPSSFLNLTLQHSDAQQGGHGHVESTVTFDSHASTDTSPATVKSASSTPTFGPTHVSGSMGSPSFISIPASYDPNSMVTTPTISATSGNRRPQLKQNSCTQSRSTSSSPAFKPMISPNLKPLLPGGTPTEVANTLASKSNYQNILEGKHNQLGLSYPKELSSGIESRRTSHKVAEQARRSRINNAIDLLGTMLPGETDGISKAITVEKAIDYIKNLEEQLAKTKAELAAKQK